MRTQNARIYPTDAPRVGAIADALRQQDRGKWDTADVIQKALDALESQLKKSPMAATIGALSRTSTPVQRGRSS